MTHRIDRTIDSIIGQLEHLTSKLPAARTHLLAQLATAGEPAAHPTDTPGRGGGQSTSVEAAILTRAHLRNQLDGLNDELNAIALIAVNLRRDCDRIIGTRTVTPRCDGGVGRDGYLVPASDGGWSNPGCWNVPDGSTTCDTCIAAAEAWQRREDEAKARAKEATRKRVARKAS
jgi:hypothetical protein